MSNVARLNLYSEINATSIRWLWYPYIAEGKLTLIQGDPGCGKTTLSMIIASSLSRGENLMSIEGLDIRRKSNVIYQTAEDGVEDTIKPKLDRLGADCSRISYLKDDTYLNLENDSLEKIIKEASAKLIILDPIQSFLAKGKSLQSVSNIRPMMKNLARIANKTSCAIVLIGHLNKAERSKDLYRGLGSVDITAVARSILYVRKSEDNPNVRIISQIKNSIEHEGVSLAFSITKNGEIKWLGEYTDETKPVIEMDDTDIAKELIIEYLEEHEKPLTEIQNLVEPYISRRTLFRIKKELEIKSIYKEHICYWKL